MTQTQTSFDHISQLTSQCVMCGLCLPHCPTYAINQDESESPRGRISIIQAVAKKQLSLDKASAEHLSNCLQCLSCQSVCPSQVAYEEIIFTGQQMVYQHQQPGLKSKLSQQLLSQPLLKSVYKSGFNLLAHTHLLKPIKHWAEDKGIRSSYYLPDTAIKSRIKGLSQNPNLQSTNPELSPIRASLFIGCGNSLFDPQLLNDSAPFWQQLGLQINQVDSQNCCGAFLKREGNLNALEQQAQQNQQAYNDPDEVILSFTSTCSAQLDDNIQPAVFDVCSYLADEISDRFKALSFKPLAKTIIWHASCSLRNQLKQAQAPLSLLKAIPDLEILNLMDSGCCGAGGNYMLSHPEMADKIVQPYIDIIKQSGSHTLVSSNITCALHIRAELEKQDYKLEVLHPISLLSQQLITQ